MGRHSTRSSCQEDLEQRQTHLNLIQVTYVLNRPLFLDFIVNSTGTSSFVWTARACYSDTPASINAGVEDGGVIISCRVLYLFETSRLLPKPPS